MAKGSCWVQANDGVPKLLSEGDIIIFPHGDSHILGDRLDQEPVLVSRLLPEPPWTEPLLMKYGGGGEVSKLVCGFLHCEEMLMHPFLKTLPPLIHVQSCSGSSALIRNSMAWPVIVTSACEKPSGSPAAIRIWVVTRSSPVRISVACSLREGART